MRMPRALSTTWDAADPTRRTIVAVLAVGILAALALLVAAGPLRAAIDRADSDVARSRLLLAVARERVAEMESLARATPAPRAPDLRAAVLLALARHDVQAALVDARSTDERVSILLAQARFDAIVTATDELAQRDGVRLVEGKVTALVDPGRVRAELTFGR
jgi:type II secretory pathway component PulM